MNTLSREVILKLIEAGIQAPSADNSQPWKFKIVKDGLELWLDSSNMGLFFDVKQVATQISCGAVIENIVLLAQATGFKTRIDYAHDSFCVHDAGQKFAQLTFVPGDQVEDEVSVREAIFNRFSNRKIYRFNKKIPDELIHKLTAIGTAENCFIQAYHSPQDKNEITRIVSEAEAIRFVHEKMHSDFYKVLRFGKTAQQTRDGLAADTLGIEAISIPLLARLKSWRLTQWLNRIGLYRFMAFRGMWLPLRSSSTVVSIVHKGEANYVESGRVVERFWIEANQAGLSVQAIGAIPLFFARLHEAGGEGFSSAQLTRLSVLEADFAQVTPGFAPKTDQLIMLFRLGYGANVARSYRRSVETFLV